MEQQNESPFPARVLIKVIMSAKETAKVNQERITAAVEPAGFTAESFSSRLSGKGRWMSLSFFSEIESSEALSDLYDILREVPGARMVL